MPMMIVEQNLGFSINRCPVASKVCFTMKREVEQRARSACQLLSFVTAAYATGTMKLPESWGARKF